MLPAYSYLHQESYNAKGYNPGSTQHLILKTGLAVYMEMKLRRNT